MHNPKQYLNHFECSIIVILLTVSGSIQAQDGNQAETPEMGFFVTSVGLGDGANLVVLTALMLIARHWLRQMAVMAEPGMLT